jgi:two-component system, LytTR family, sensor kinase
MLTAISFQNPAFINTLGHASGLVLFGVLTALVLKGWNKGPQRSRRASLIASLVVFLWNGGSLVALGLTQRLGHAPEWLIAINFSVLSILPAILFSVAAKDREPVLVRLGYLVGGCSVVLHFAELVFPSSRLHEAALLLVAFGFAALVAVAAARPAARRRGSISPASLISLFIFALSFLHFVYGHLKAGWADDVAWHHAGIPLALIVLLRDYRFLLAETYLRFLANIGLSAIWAVCMYWALGAGSLLQEAKNNGFLAALLLIGFCCSLVLFAYLRSLLDKHLTRSAFQRGDLNACSKELLTIATESQSEEELLQKSAALIARFVGAEPHAISSDCCAKAPAWAEIQIPLRFSRGDALTLLFGSRQGSRRYLQDDVASLNFLANLLVGQVERFRTNELQRLAQAAELRALQAQVNPHFLFNALNTLYGTIHRESFEARRMVLNLAELFRYSLQRDRTFIPLGEEIEIVQAYLEVESLRLQDRLSFEISVDENTRHLAIPVLSVQPLVENAIKHGVSKLSGKGKVRVEAKLLDKKLQVTVQDNGPGLRPDAASSGLGIGLENVRQRLHLSYGADAELRIVSSGGGCYATMLIPFDAARVSRSPEGQARSQPEGARPSGESAASTRNAGN